MRLFSARFVCALACLAFGTSAVEAKGRRKAVSPARVTIEQPKDAAAGAPNSDETPMATSRRRTPVAPSKAAVEEPKGQAAGETKELRALLQAKPDSDLIICLAGCGPAGQPKVIFERRRGSAFLAEAATPPGTRSSQGDQTHREMAAKGKAVDDVARQGERAENQSNDIICLAGCTGPVGVVVFRGRQLAWITNDKKDAILQSFAAIAAGTADADGSGDRTGPNGVAAQRSWVSATARDSLVKGLAAQLRRAQDIYAAWQTGAQPDAS